MKRHLSSAFSLLEVLLIIAGIGVVAACGYVALVSVKSSADKTKLEQDVTILNRAVRIYQISGGSIPAGSTEEQVLERLRLVAADPKKVAGLKGRMIDPRLSIRRQNAEEAGQPMLRAYWNESAGVFEVAGTGEKAGVKEFYLGAGPMAAAVRYAEDGSVIPEGTDNRQTTFDFAQADKWVWDYTGDTTTPTATPTHQPTGDSVSDTPPQDAKEILTLGPPVFSIPTGTYPLGEYPKDLTLSLPNGVSSQNALIYYLAPGSGWERYTAPIAVDPGTLITAKTVTMDPDNFADSNEKANRYLTTPLALELSVTFPRSTYRYAELGGPVVQGTPGQAAPGTLKVTGPGGVQDRYFNNTNFEVAWTTDGTDPANSATRSKLENFSGLPPEVPLSLGIAQFQAANAYRIRAVAIAKNTDLFATSDEKQVTLGIEKTQLGPLAAAYNGINVSMAPVSLENLPANPRIYYTATGDDPGDNGAGDPSFAQALLYASPVTPSGDLTQFSGRLYPPTTYKAWFTPGTTGYVGVSKPAAGNFYATSSAENRIYQFDAVTGRNIILTDTCLFPPASVAFLGGAVQRVYYIEQSGGNWRLGSYGVADSAHRDHGSLTAGAFSYQPGSKPSNLTAFNGSLFYVPDQTDDLVRLDFAADGSIREQYKFADITYDTAAFNMIGDIAITPQGKLYVSAVNAWASFDVRTLAPITLTPGTPLNVWAGLLINGSGSLLGVKSGDAGVLYAVNPATGAGTSAANFSPARAFDDFGGPVSDIPFDLPSGHYAIAPGREAVYRVDLETGRNYVLRTGLGFAPGAAAFQPSTGKVFLTSSGDLRLYVFNPQDSSVTEITGLYAAGIAYPSATPPRSLAWYNNALYYTVPGTDDLVKITLAGNTVATREKVADLLGNSSTGTLDGMSIGPDGVCYFANSDVDRLAYYDLGNLGGFTPVTTAAPSKFLTVTFNAGGQMHAVPAAAADRTKLYTVNSDTGAATFKTVLLPAVEFSDITGLNDSAPTPLNTEYFTVDGSSPRIYRLDPTTGQNRILNGAAPWPLGTLAYDQENQTLYYTRAGSYELGSYNLGNNTHTLLTPLNDASLAYIPSAAPENLTFFNGSLYYIAPDTDDLVRLEVVSGAVRAAWKEADMSGNTATAGISQDTAVDASGRLYTTSSTISARFDLTTLSGWTVLAQPAADSFPGLFAASGGSTFYGSTAAFPRRVSSLNPANGQASAVAVTAPERTIRDAAAAQARVTVTPPEGVYYAAVTGQPILYRVNPATGAMQIATASCPVIPEAVAFDPETKSVYYTSTAQGSGTTVNLYKYDPAQQRHSAMGNLSAATLSSKAGATLEALAFFCGDLYYINPNTDDLIRVYLSATGITAADKAADLTGNAKSLGVIGAMAVSNNGTLYLSRLDAPLLASVKLYTRNSYTELNTTNARLGAMVMDAGNVLYAAASDTPAVLESVNTTTGARTFKANTSPSRPLRDIAGLNTVPEPELPECYAVGGGNRSIYKFDPVTGVTYAITRTAPFNLDGLARDPSANILYYLEQSAIPWRIGRYDVAAKVHSTMATVGATGNNYNAAVRPSNLFFYDGNLYFIADNTDDLVQIQLGAGGTSVVAITKAADLMDDASAFGTIGDVVADATGAALFTDSTGRLRTFNMKVLTNVWVLATGLPNYRAIILNSSGGFYGAQATTPTSLYSLNRSTGAAVLTAASFPTVTFADMAGHETAAPYQASDSLWAVSDSSNALGEFKNWNLPNVSAKTWAGLRYYSTGTTGTTAFTGPNELEGMAVTSAGMAYFASSRAVTVDGVTYQRALFSLDLNAASASASSTPPVLTFVGSFDRMLSGYALTNAADNNLTGLALAADGLFYGLLNTATGTDQLLRLNSLATDSAKQFNNVSIMGALTGASETVTDGEDLTVAPGGMLYVTDDADDRISLVNPATAAVTSIFSADTPVAYEGLTVHPASGEVVASNADAGFIRRVRSGAANDVNRFSSTTVSANVLTDVEAIAFPSGSPTALNDPAPPYFAADLTTSLYRVNPVNGRTVLLTDSAPFAVNSVAHDAASGLVYYLEDSDSSIRLGVYNISANTHTVLGNLRTYGAFRPTSRPQDFVWYAGSLYYLNPGSSQLVRVRLDTAGTALAAQELAATLVEGATWTATATAVDGSGQLYFSAGTALYCYNLATLSGLTTINTAAGAWQSLVFTSGPAQLYGTASGSLSRIDAITSGSGASTVGAATTPVRSFSSMTGPGTGALPPDSPYYASNRTNRLYTIDPVTGITTLLANTAPYVLDAIALDESAGVVYFLANTDTSTSLGRYTISSGAFANIGQLMDNAATGLTVGLRPLHLVTFQGSLYYIRRSTTAAEKDDLIRVTLNAGGTAITAQEKIADLNGNADWGDVGGATLDDDGWLYFNTGTQLRKYNLRTQTGAAVVSSSFVSHPALLWHRSRNSLYGSPSSSGTKVNPIALSNGTRGTLVTNSLGITLRSFASGNRALPAPSLTAPPAYIVGDFSRTSGGDFRDVARLNSDGSLDTNFNVGAGTNTGSIVRTAARAGDGKLLVGGNFTTFNGTARAALARLNASGALDTSFVPSIEAVSSATPFTLDWSTLGLNQSGAVAGTDTVNLTSSDATHGLSTSGGFTGFGSQVFSNIAGSGIDMTLYYSQNMSAAPNLHGPSGSGYNAGENPDRRVTGPVALRFTNDRTSPFTPATLGVSFSEPVYFDRVLLGSVSTVGGHAENALFRAWDGADATGNLIPATTFTNYSAENGPVFGTSADPITVNALANVLTSTPATSRYLAIGDGKEEENRYGRAQFTFTGTPVRSLAFSNWTTLTTTTSGSGGSFDPNKPFGVAQDFSMFSYGNFEIAAGGAGTKAGVAVGGNMTYGYNGGFYMDGVAGVDALIVQGILNTNGNGALSKGNAVYGSSPDPSKIYAYGGTKRQATNVLPFADIKAAHLTLSAQWKALANTSGSTISYTPVGGDGKVPVTLNANNLTGTVVFNLDPAKLVSIANWNINNIAAGATILINIPGATPPTLQNCSINVGGSSDAQKRVIFHYPDATTAGFGSIAIPGTVFAPKGLVTMNSNGGQLLGHVIAERIELRSTYNGGQYTFSGTGLPGPSGPPVTTTAVSGGNGALTFCLSGFRRTTGLPGSVWAVKTQSDGKIVIGGRFAAINGTARKNIARLNADGSLDTTFDPGTGPNGDVYSLLLLADGGVMAGGEFTSWNGSTAGAKLVSLTNTGMRNTGFTSPVSTAASDVVRWIQPDSTGNILIGGKFTAPANGLARITSSGANDASFAPGSGTGGGAVNTGVIQPDGTLLIAGEFTSFNGLARNHIALLTASGAPVSAWSPGAGFDGLVNAILQLPGSGFVHSGGAFNNYNGVPRTKVSVLEAETAAAGVSPWGPSTLGITTVYDVE